MLRQIFSLLLFFSLVSYTFAAGEKIVVIDIQKVVEQSQAGKEAQQILEKQARMAQQEIQAQAKGNQQAAQTLAAQKQQELMQKRQELIEKFMKIVQNAMEKFAKQNNYILVLDKQAVLYNKSTLDKTQEFINFFNKEYAKGEKLK